MPTKRQTAAAFVDGRRRELAGRQALAARPRARTRRGDARRVAAAAAASIGLWLRTDGHLVLLDFAAPGAETTRSDERELTPGGLLSVAATRALAAMSREHEPPPMPLSARPAGAMVETRRLTSRRPALVAIGAQDEVRRSRRAIPIALAAAPALVVVSGSALMLP